jgi:ribosomal protein S18 acetylase RimI-like enzyme
VNEPPTIRFATIDDAPVIARFNAAMALESENVKLDPATLNAGVRAALSGSHDCSYFLAEIDGHVAGQIMITHEWSDWRNGDIWWIQSVFVEKDFRRRGVFRAMYQFVRERAIEAGAVGLRLYVNAHNERAQKTYTSLGMHVTNYQLMEEMFGAAQSQRR